MPNANLPTQGDGHNWTAPHCARSESLPQLSFDTLCPRLVCRPFPSAVDIFREVGVDSSEHHGL
jgi:hypothetical protein